MKKRALLPWAIATGVLLSPIAAMAQSAPALPGGGVEGFGASGTMVAILQADLRALNDSPGALDGLFGPRTLTAVRAFQGRAGIAVDGVVGPITWGAIHDALTTKLHLTTGTLASAGADYGDVGAPIVELQADLAAQGFHPGPQNGVFLNDTAQAVQAFERAHGYALNDHLNAAELSALTGTQVPAGQASSGAGSSTGSNGPTSSSGSTGGNGSTGSSGSTGTSTGGGGATTSSGSTQTIDGYTVVSEINLTATAYAPTLQDNYPYGPVDYYGRPLVAGDVAVDPTVIPLGTLMWVTGYSFQPYLPQGGFLARAVDTGGAIKGDRLDIFINQSESTVSMFGIQQVKAYILK